MFNFLSKSQKFTELFVALTMRQVQLIYALCEISSRKDDFLLAITRAFAGK